MVEHIFLMYYEGDEVRHTDLRLLEKRKDGRLYWGGELVDLKQHFVVPTHPWGRDSKYTLVRTHLVWDDQGNYYFKGFENRNALDIYCRPR